MKVQFLDLKVRIKILKISFKKFENILNHGKVIEGPELTFEKKMTYSQICSWTFIWQQCTLLGFKALGIKGDEVLQTFHMDYHYKCNFGCRSQTCVC